MGRCLPCWPRQSNRSGAMRAVEADQAVLQKQAFETMCMLKKCNSKSSQTFY